MTFLRNLFFDSAAEKARKASLDAAIANRQLEEAALLLRDIEARLLDVSKKLDGTKVPPAATSSIRRTMRNVRRHAHAMLTHMRRLDTHVKHLDSHLRR